MTEAWWKGAVLYHVYVRSFFDSDGDGHGDLPGVMAKLDYIQRLGVDGIWLSPIHPSPNRDWGYDIADYEGVQADYGTPEDFQALLDAAHERGLKVVLDEVLSHTSDEHAWFVDSLTGGPNGPKADWYVWADPKDDGTAPNNWLSVFGGPAWAYQPARRQHYHHKFLRQQPKLNWRSAGAREAALSVLDLWLEKGVDGFRLDVAGTYLHDEALTDNPPAEKTERAWRHASDLQRHLHDSNLPENVEMLDLIRRRVERHNGKNGGDRFVFGEFSEEEERCGGYLSPEDGLHSAYTFVLLLADKLSPETFREHYRTFERFTGHWPTISFSNHDVPRTVSRFGGDGSPDFAKLMFALLISLKGTTLIYQGEELGLPQASLSRDQLRDPVGDLYWPYSGGRDGCRTPMPWEPGEALGFTDGAPWLPAASEHARMTVADQEEDPDSPLVFARQMIAFRKASPTMRTGDIEFVEMDGPILAFVRRSETGAVGCIFNLSPEPQFVHHDIFEEADLWPVRAGDADLRGGSIGLSPWAAAFLNL